MVAEAPAKNARFTVAVLIAAAAALYIWRLAVLMPQYDTDFDPIRLGARLLLHGETPYQIGPGRAHIWNFPLLYPMPAVLLGVPFVWPPIVPARALFVGITSGTLAYVCTRRAWWPLFVFASASWLDAIGLAQWSPGLLAASYLPALGFIIAAKPNIGLAICCASKSRRELAAMAAGVALLVVVSFIVRPTWFGEWRASIHDQSHIRPLLLMPLGWPLLLAAFRWRSPEARLLLALGAVPQNPALYEGVLLFAVPRSWRQALVLATLSWFVEPMRYAIHTGSTFELGARAWATALLVLMYLPALALVIWNETGPACATSATGPANNSAVGEVA